MALSDFVSMWEAGGQAGREARTRRTLADYAQPALQGDQKALGQIYSVDPKMGYEVDGMAQQRRRQRISEIARAAATYRDLGDKNAWAYVRQGLIEIDPQMFGNVPLDLTTPEDIQGSMKVADAFVSNYGGGQSSTGVQSTFVDAQGNRIALMRDGSTQVVGKAAPTTQVIQGADGYYTVDKATGRATPVVMGGAQQAAPQGGDYYTPQQAEQFPVMESSGMPVRIEPGLDPAIVASMQQNPDAWATGQPQQLPPRVTQPPPQQIRPYQAPPSYVDQRKLAIDERELQLKEQQAKEQAEIRARQQRAREEEARRKAAQAQRVPEIEDIERGIDRLEAALKALEDNKLFDGGAFDARALSWTKEGQDLIATVGAMQNSLNSLTRVPGMGSQSDLEAKLAALRLPSLEMNPETNRATLDNLKKFIEDIRAARGLPPRSGQTPQRPAPQRPQPAPQPRRPVLPSEAAVQRVRFNPETGEIE